MHINECSKCNGELLGDGYTHVVHCENADERKYQYCEPDAQIIECDFKDEVGIWDWMIEEGYEWYEDSLKSNGE